MFTLLMELGSVAGKAIKAAKAAADRDSSLTAADLATIVLRETKDWKPTLNGQPVLTPSLRGELARALAGLAYNLSAVEHGRKAA